MTLEQAAGREETAEELLADLAHEPSLLVRSELDVAVAERGPWLHRLAVELAASFGAAFTILLTLAAASWAAAEGLRLVLPAWLAALTVAAAWGIVSGLLLSVDHPRRLWERLSKQTHGQAITTALEHRSAKEADVRATAARMSHAISAEMRGKSLSPGLAVGRRLITLALSQATLWKRRSPSVIPETSG